MSSQAAKRRKIYFDLSLKALKIYVKWLGEHPKLTDSNIRLTCQYLYKKGKGNVRTNRRDVTLDNVTSFNIFPGGAPENFCVAAARNRDFPFLKKYFPRGRVTVNTELDVWYALIDADDVEMIEWYNKTCVTSLKHIQDALCNAATVNSRNIVKACWSSGFSRKCYHIDPDLFPWLITSSLPGWVDVVSKWKNDEYFLSRCLREGRLASLQMMKNYGFKSPYWTMYRSACVRNSVELMKWVHENFPIDSLSKDNEIFSGISPSMECAKQAAEHHGMKWLEKQVTIEFSFEIKLWILERSGQMTRRLLIAFLGAKKTDYDRISSYATDIDLKFDTYIHRKLSVSGYQYLLRQGFVPDAKFFYKCAVQCNTALVERLLEDFKSQKPFTGIWKQSWCETTIDPALFDAIERQYPLDGKTAYKTAVKLVENHYGNEGAFQWILNRVPPRYAGLLMRETCENRCFTMTFMVHQKYDIPVPKAEIYSLSIHDVITIWRSQFHVEARYVHFPDDYEIFEQVIPFIKLRDQNLTDALAVSFSEANFQRFLAEKDKFVH